MLSTFFSHFIVIKIEVRECLQEKRQCDSKRIKENNIHPIVREHISQVLNSIGTDSVFRQEESGE
jgi:hypothetical protein